MSDQDVQYIKMPDGSYGKFAANASDDVIKGAIAKDFPEAFKETDERNAIQKSFDTNTQTSPNDPLLKTGLKSVVGAIGAPFVHPLDTAVGMAQSLRHPIDAVHGEVDQLYADKAAGGLPYAATKAVGNAVGSVALGEAGGAAVAPALRAAKVGLGRAALLGKTPEAAYESALKPSTVLSQGERTAAVQTGLENSIPISKGGLEKLQGHIETLNQAIKDEIGKDPNRPIDPNKVATRADDARARFSNQVNAGGDLKAIEDSKNQFLSEQGATPLAPAPDMAASKAQAMKQGTYSVLKGKYNEVGSAATEAQKALARGLKEEIATQFPEISKLNANESRLLNLEPLLERAVNRTGNHQLVGLGTPVAAAGVKAITNSNWVAGVTGVLKGVVDNPAVKSHLAIAISKSSKIPYSQALAKVQAYSASLGASLVSADGSSGNPDQSTTPQP